MTIAYLLIIVPIVLMILGKTNNQPILFGAGVILSLLSLIVSIWICVKMGQEEKKKKEEKEKETQNEIKT